MSTSIKNSQQSPTFGVSGISVYLPRFRVPLDQWCEWTGRSFEKVQATVGNSFRVSGPQGSIYTLAANATLRLILQYDIDPRSVGFIGLGTESSTDNSAGAILVKGLVDQALKAKGLPMLSRQCEVPEFKHACLGGVYAMKSGLRYLALDGRGRTAIAVSADIAEYERNSSGEQTQGAGAVAMLLEENPKLYSVDLTHAGSAASYRGVDFRKPHRRHLGTRLSTDTLRFPDYPVFNGKYSTVCYTDEAMHAVARMIQRMDTKARKLFHEVEGVFLHRPYHRLPFSIFAALYVWGLTRNEEHLPELEALCTEANADYETTLNEAASNPDLFKGALGGKINNEVYPESMKVVKHFRNTEKFAEVCSSKMHLGVAAMMEVGNIYTGSLPAWIGAGLEEAFDTGIDLCGKSFLTIGYGSGDAAEAMLVTIAKDWQEAAAKIGFKNALKGAINLKREEYEGLHDCLREPCPPYTPSNEFIIDHVGETNDSELNDLGIEFYRYVP
jgi:hydroxymethylglutaryl-CoA synthase